MLLGVRPGSRDRLQSLVPPTFQLTGHQTVRRVHCLMAPACQLLFVLGAFDVLLPMAHDLLLLFLNDLKGPKSHFHTDGLDHVQEEIYHGPLDPLSPEGLEK